MNEELQTVNQGKRHKVNELAHLSSDLHNLLTATDIATLFLDRELRLVRFTPSVVELFDVRSVDRGRPIADLTHRLGYDDLADDAAEVLRTLIPVERELQDDGDRWFLTRLLPYRGTDDRIEGVVITFVDITNQKRAEEAWRLSEERLRHVAEAVPSVMFATDDYGVVRFVSGQTMAVMGVEAEDLLGTRMWPELIHPDDRPRAREAWDAARREARWLEDRYRLAGTDGQPAVMVRATPVRNDSGQVTEWFGTITDVSELAEVEQALSISRDTLEQRVKERTTQVQALALSLSRAELEERRRIGQILHDDLQQHLYGVQLKLSFTRQEAEQGDTVAALEALSQAESRLLHAIEITRSLSVDLNPPLLDDGGLVESLHWLGDHMNELHGLTVQVTAEEPVDLDSRETKVLLFHATRELLFNVAKHAETQRAVVDVRLASEGCIELTVSDDGVGFAFDEYDGELGGIGLKSVQERVRLLGGSLDVESHSGRGARVSIRVPVAEATSPRKGVGST